MPPMLRPLSAPDTQPHLLLWLTAISGEFPAALVSRLPGGSSYKESVVKRLKHDGLLRTYYRDGLRGLRLTTAAKKLLLADQPEQFWSYLTGSTETNVLKSEVPRRLRLHRMAEVLVTMLNADAAIFQAEKPSLFTPAPPPPGLRIDWPAYYGSREIKEMGAQAVKVRGSRSTGVLLADGGVFVIYNIGSSLMKWEYKAEMRLKALLQTELCRHRLASQFQDAPLQGVVFGLGMEPLIPLMSGAGGNKRNYFVLDGNYDRFYYLTSDHRGEVILRLLCQPGQRAALDQILSENLYAHEPGLLIEHDAIDETEAPVLFGYLCDMPRIQRFASALELQGRTGTLICFDFQEEALHRLCGPRVAIQSIDFEKYERSVLHFQTEPD